jgi:hypothetical protein
MKLYVLAAAGIGLAALPAFAEPAHPYIGKHLTPCKPVSYTAPDTGVVFRTDGRFLVATALGGHRIWRRDPHRNISTYRTPAPCISYLGAPEDWQVHRWVGHFIGLAFDNSQFGVVDAATGDFTFMGQD